MRLLSFALLFFFFFFFCWTRPDFCETEGLLLAVEDKSFSFQVPPLNEKLIFALVAGNEGGSRNVLHPGATELESFWCSFSCSHNWLTIF